MPYFPQQIAGGEVRINFLGGLLLKLVLYNTRPKGMHKLKSIKTLVFISFSNENHVSDLSSLNTRRTENTQNVVHGTAFFISSKGSQL